MPNTCDPGVRILGSFEIYAFFAVNSSDAATHSKSDPIRPRFFNGSAANMPVMPFNTVEHLEQYRG